METRDSFFVKEKENIFMNEARAGRFTHAYTKFYKFSRLNENENDHMVKKKNDNLLRTTSM
jgi:hypothetical protein